MKCLRKAFAFCRAIDHLPQYDKLGSVTIYNHSGDEAVIGGQIVSMTEISGQYRGFTEWNR